MFFIESELLAAEHPALAFAIQLVDELLSHSDGGAVISPGLYSSHLALNKAKVQSVLELLTEKSLLRTETMLVCPTCGGFNARPRTECSHCFVELGSQSPHQIVYRFTNEAIGRLSGHSTVGDVASSSGSTAPFSPNSSVLFPPPLIDAYRQNRVAVLFGSGLSLADDVVGAFPRWNELPDRMIDQVMSQGVWTPDQVDARRAVFHRGYMSLEAMLTELDTARVALRSVRKYQTALNAIFRPKGAAPGNVHRALVELDLNMLATTNYDLLLEHAEGPPVRIAYTWMDSSKALSDIEEGRKVLFKIHGTAEKEDSVVMSRSEYEAASRDPSYQRTMGFLLQSHTFLMVGYGINDPLDLDLVFELNAKVFGGAARTHYALVKDPSQNDRDRWLRELNVQIIPYQDHRELPAILRALRARRQ